KGGGVFRTATEIKLRPKKTGSAEESARYVPPTLPSKIIIPARAASAGTAFTLHLARATAGAIVVGVGATFQGSTVEIPDVRVLIDRFTWDVDASGRLNITDVILIGRYLDGDFPGLKLVEGVAPTTSYEQIVSNLQRGAEVLNVSGLQITTTNRKDIALENARLLWHYFNGGRRPPRWPGLDPRIDWPTVQANIQAFMP
ncbi:MAG: hypothetical protein MPL62_16445, partial [Alphaproteobacteria bacterium]|nr:hypothetical protein [Alphaproteobacteria bacterium]